MPSTKPDEFEKFVEKIEETAPDGYTPWFFPVQKKSKAPGVGKNISWKSEKSRLTKEEALERFKSGKNVGISGRENDKLILVDIDDPTIEDDLKPTLKIRSRSRTGTHAIYWADSEDPILPANIPTDKGEVRSEDQYVVAPGSYVPCTDEELAEKVRDGEITESQAQKIKEDENRGVYTVDNNHEISTIEFDELPKVFQEHYLDAQKKKRQQSDREEFEPDDTSNSSALFDLDITNVCPTEFDKRVPHPTHGSPTTEMNWLVDSSRGIGHCWRHLVSLNAIQYLCVEAGYLTCQNAGTPHHNGGGGPSAVIDNDEAIWVAWKYAKEQGYIPGEDPAPVRALKHIVSDHEIEYEEEDDYDGMLPREAYRKAIEIIEEEYGINPGREKPKKHKHTWNQVIAKYFDEDAKKEELRTKIANIFLERYHFKTIRDNENLWVFKNPVYDRQAEQLIRETVFNEVGEYINDKDVREAIEEIKARTYTDRPGFSENAHLIALQNGVYNLETGKLEEGNPDRFLTTELPINYNPDAECPQIKEFLGEVVEDENVPVLQELIGYCLYTDYPRAKAFMLRGEGENGKSTFLTLLQEFLGEENVVNPSLQSLLYDRFKKVQLYGKLANIHADLSTKKLNNTGTFKMLTGEDRIEGERKYEDSFYFKNHAKLIYSANELPATDDLTDAFFRRWIIIDFPYKFTSNPDDGHKDKDDSLPESILSDEELSGLFNWAIEGLQRVLEDGFTMTGSMEDVKEEWLTRTNPLEIFIEKHCEFDGETEVVKEDFLEAVNEFCKRHDTATLNMQTVTKKLKTKGVETTRPEDPDDDSDNRVRLNCYKGVRVGGEYEDSVRVVRGKSTTSRMREEEDKKNYEKVSSKNPARPDQDSSRNKGFINVKEKVLQFVDDNDDGEGVYITDIQSSFDVEDEKIKEVLEKLLDDGGLFEPRPGVVKKL